MKVGITSIRVKPPSRTDIHTHIDAHLFCERTNRVSHQQTRAAFILSTPPFGIYSKMLEQQEHSPLNAPSRDFHLFINGLNCGRCSRGACTPLSYL